MGFVLELTQPAWTAAMGFYQLDPREDQAAADARLEQQLAAIRTLFATRRGTECVRGWMPATRERYIGPLRARDGTDHGPSGVQRNRRGCGFP